MLQMMYTRSTKEVRRRRRLRLRQGREKEDYYAARSRQRISLMVRAMEERIKREPWPGRRAKEHGSFQSRGGWRFIELSDEIGSAYSKLLMGLIKNVDLARDILKCGECQLKICKSI